MTIEEVEKNLGLNPNDPIVPFALLLGTASTFWYDCPLVLFSLLIPHWTHTI